MFITRLQFLLHITNSYYTIIFFITQFSFFYTVWACKNVLMKGGHFISRWPVLLHTITHTGLLKSQMKQTDIELVAMIQRFLQFQLALRPIYRIEMFFSSVWSIFLDFIVIKIQAKPNEAAQLSWLFWIKAQFLLVWSRIDARSAQRQNLVRSSRRLSCKIFYDW